MASKVNLRRVVHKVNLPQISCHHTTAIPRDADLLSVQAQNGDIALWFLCDPNNPPAAREFLLHETGEEFDIQEGEEHRYVGTVQLTRNRGVQSNYVLHVFEVIKRRSCT